VGPGAPGRWGFWAPNAGGAVGGASAKNLLHAAGTLAGRPHIRARGATLRRQLIAVPARLARPARARVLHLPSRWPWAPAWLHLWDHTIGHSPPAAA
jgi:hypothetical protein